MSDYCNTGDTQEAPFSSAQIQQTVAAQRAWFNAGSTRSLESRKQALGRILEGLEAREDAFIEALAADLGKPPVEAWLAEIYFIKQELRHMLRHLGRWMKPKRARNPIFVLPASSEIHREPFGVVLVIAPWNYPLQLALSPAIGAIAAGNCVVIKPSEAAPATARLLAELVATALPATHATVILGGPDVGDALLKERFDHYFFTGGEKIGRMVAAAAARELAPCVLELGGKSPAVLDWSGDMDLAVERIVAAKFFNAGQTCMAPDFVAVPHFRLDEFSSKLEATIDRYYGADMTDLTCLPHQAQWDRLMKLIPDHARRIGEDNPERLRLAPRWAVVDWEDPCMQEEIFGPFLPIIAYPEREACLSRLASLPSPLALYLFSNSEAFIENTIHQIPSGSVCVNDLMKQAINLNLPFGGVGPSGHGRYRGKTSFETFTWQRSITRRFNFRDPFSVSPPYGNLLEKVRTRLR